MRTGLFRRVANAGFEAILTPVNFIASCGVYCDDAYSVDWGDGTFIDYLAAATTSVVPTGTITVKGAGTVTHCKFTTDTYSAIDITKSKTLTSLYKTFRFLRAMTTVAIQSTENVTTLEQAFYSCEGLTVMPSLDLSSAIILQYAFYRTGVIAFPTLSYPVTEDFYQAWGGSVGLTSCGDIIAPDGLDFSFAFVGCTALIDCGDITTASATTLTGMFRNCDNLRCVSSISTVSPATLRTIIFDGCGVLKHPTPPETTDLTDASGAVFTNVSTTDCVAFTHNGVIVEGKDEGDGYTYWLGFGDYITGTEASGPECTIKFGHTDTIITATTGWSFNGNQHEKTLSATATLYAVYDITPDGWAYWILVNGSAALLSELGIYMVDGQTISIEREPVVAYQYKCVDSPVGATAREVYPLSNTPTNNGLVSFQFSSTGLVVDMTNATPAAWYDPDAIEKFFTYSGGGVQIVGVPSNSTLFGSTARPWGDVYKYFILEQDAGVFADEGYPGTDFVSIL